jgi:adenylate cyclase
MSFLAEIRRRKVFQVAAVYAVTAWLLVQIIVAVEAPLNLPEWTDSLVIVLLGIGFPIALVFSWAFNLTSDGLMRDRGGRPAQARGRTIEYVLIGLVVVALGWLIFRLEFDAAGTGESDKLPNSIAVLLCDNLSPDPDNAFFAASLHEEILNQLVRLGALNVIARTSVMQYADAARPIPEIADELRVESIMECSVSYGDDRVAITTQLVDGDTGVHLWSERYNRELRDVFAIQADIAMNVANALRAELSLDEQATIEGRATESP